MAGELEGGGNCADSKEEGREVRDYRGMTLIPTLYKVYTSMLVEKLWEEVEGKRIIPRTQTHFKKGMKTMDNVYVLNYVVNRQIGRAGGKLIALFVDLRAAFDSVNRRVLVKAIKRKGIREGLMRRIEDVIRETRSRVRTGES